MTMQLEDRNEMKQSKQIYKDGQGQERQREKNRATKYRNLLFLEKEASTVRLEVSEVSAASKLSLKDSNRKNSFSFDE